MNFEDLEITMRKTIRQVEQIKETLKAIQENNILKMYVDKSVLRYMNRKEFEQSLMTNETVEATVVFIDICGFTRITETAPADVVVNMVNQYFDVIVKEIISQNGFIDKFMGDAVMSVFRGEYHLGRALDACLAVRAQVEKLPEIAELSFRPMVSIGICSGEVISGNIGSVSLRRLDYTVIGDVANTAKRLQSAAKPGQLVIPAAVYERIRESFKCVPLGSFTLKNKAQPVTIYEVVE